MIKFFRRVRHKLLSEKKISKYLLYAFGEIFLVVIGILIALQINNWNQNKVKTKKEIFHLENILSSLKDDLDNQISPCIDKTERQISGFELLNSGFYEKNNISHDSIRQLFFQFLGQWDLVLNTVAFDNLKSTGMDVLSNDTIKTKLLTLYGNNYKYVKNLQADYDKFHYDGITTLIHDNVNTWNSLSEEDKQFLKNDKRLTSRMFTEGYYSLPKYLAELKNIKPILQDLIENIIQELKRLKEK
jgi:hypothetical protein